MAQEAGEEGGVDAGKVREGGEGSGFGLVGWVVGAVGRCRWVSFAGTVRIGVGIVLGRSGRIRGGC